MRPDDEGPSTPAPAPAKVGGDPASLAGAGDSFRDGANALSRVQNAFFDGGANAIHALKGNDFGDQHDVGRKLEELARGMYERMWSANLELQTAALNFWDVAGAFARADAVVTYHNAGGVGTPRLKDLGNGMTAYIYDNGTKPDYTGQEVWDAEHTVVIVDREGHVITTGNAAHPPKNTAVVNRPAPPAVPLPAPGR